MVVSKKEVNLTAQQQRVLQLLFKFRFVSAHLLAQSMGIRRESVYQVLEYLVTNNLVTKIYTNEFRIDRKPAYYFLSKTGVSTVRKIMDVKESVVHTLYKNDEASEDFIAHCLTLIHLYVSLSGSLPEDSSIFTKTEINRFTQFPKNRPDLYIRTSDGREAMVVLADNTPAYITRKRLDEIITHSEDEGWDGDYPVICFVLKDAASMYSFLSTTNKKLENMGMEEGELPILALNITAFTTPDIDIWHTPQSPKQHVRLFN
jgi:Fe2+ or Zn2+ uptake regulation protein